MKIRLGLTLTLFALSLQVTAFAHNNIYAQYTLKNITKDVAVIKEPTVAPKPVNNATILHAIIRTRSVGFFLQQLNDKKGKVEGDKFVPDEMTPADIGEESDIETLKELLAVQGQALSSAKAKVEVAETQLRAELARPAEARDFTALKGSLTELEVLLMDVQS